MFRFAPWLGLALTLAACGNEFRSLNPIAVPGERLEEARLVGDWGSIPPQDMEGGSLRIRPVEGPPGEYLIAWTDSAGRLTTFHAMPTRIGGRLILDVWMEPEGEDTELLVPLHAPMYATFAGTDSLSLTSLAGRELQTWLAQQPGSLAHAWIRRPSAMRDSIVVITASTPDIRRFLADYQERTGVIDEDSPIRLRRIR